MHGSILHENILTSKIGRPGGLARGTACRAGARPHPLPRFFGAFLVGYKKGTRRRHRKYRPVYRKTKPYPRAVEGAGPYTALIIQNNVYGYPSISWDRLYTSGISGRESMCTAVFTICSVGIR